MQGSAALLRQPHTIGTLLLVGGVAIASGGASVTGRDSIGAREFKSTINFGLVVVSLPLVALGVLATIEVAGLVFDLKQLAVTTGDILFGRTGGGRIDYLGLGVTWTVTLISITSVKVGLKHLPIAELAEASRRERLTTRLDRVQSLLDKLRLLMFAAPFCVFLIELVRMTTSIGLTDAYLRILSPIGTASALRGVLFAGILLGVVSAVFVETMKRIAQLEPQRTIRRSIPFVSGLVLAVVLVQFSSELVTLAVSGPLAKYRSTVELFSSRYSEATLVVVMLVVAGVTPAGLYSVLLVIDYALLPEFADGAALLSAGLFVAAVGGLLSGPSPIVGFIGIAGSFIVWDLNTNAVSLGRELGRHTPTRQAELVHAGGSLLVATLGTVVAMGGLYLANAISAPPEGIAPVTAVISVVGLLALIVGLRGR